VELKGKDMEIFEEIEDVLETYILPDGDHLDIDCSMRLWLLDLAERVKSAVLMQGASQPVPACGDLVVVSQFSDFDWPMDAVVMGIFRKYECDQYYIDGTERGYRHCVLVHKKESKLDA